MTYTTRSAPQAAARAESTDVWTTDMCLNFVWHCLSDISANLSDANAAWAAAQQKEYDKHPPAGAPVYFRGGSHGHITISVGGGKVRSTDYRTGSGYSPAIESGRLAPVGTGTIDEIALAFFGATSAYRGWSRDYAGQIIRGLESTSSVNSGIPPIPSGGLTMSDVSDILAKLDAQNKTSAAREAAAADRYAALQKSINEVDSEATARYKYFAEKANEILAGQGDAATKLDAIKALLAG